MMRPAWMRPAFVPPAADSDVGTWAQQHSLMQYRGEEALLGVGVVVFLSGKVATDVLDGWLRQQGRLGELLAELGLFALLVTLVFGIAWALARAVRDEELSIDPVRGTATRAKRRMASVRKSTTVSIHEIASAEVVMPWLADGRSDVVRIVFAEGTFLARVPRGTGAVFATSLREFARPGANGGQ